MLLQFVMVSLSRLTLFQEEEQHPAEILQPITKWLIIRHKQSTQLSSGYFYPTSFSTEHSVWYRDRQEATKNQSFWAFSIRPNTVDILFTNQKELAINFWFCLTRILGTSLEDGPLSPVQSNRLVSQTYSKCPFPFAQIVVPSIALLYLV